jgi:hypothetical protein
MGLRGCDGGVGLAPQHRRTAPPHPHRPTLPTPPMPSPSARPPPCLPYLRRHAAGQGQGDCWWGATHAFGVPGLPRALRLQGAALMVFIGRELNDGGCHHTQKGATHRFLPSTPHPRPFHFIPRTSFVQVLDPSVMQFYPDQLFAWSRTHVLVGPPATSHEEGSGRAREAGSSCLPRRHATTPPRSNRNQGWTAPNRHRTAPRPERIHRIRQPRGAAAAVTAQPRRARLPPTAPRAAPPGGRARRRPRQPPVDAAGRQPDRRDRALAQRGG